MKFLLIPDKFKGSLSSTEVVEALSHGIRHVYPEAGIEHILASDGGEGFLDAVSKDRLVERIETMVAGPLGRPLQAYYLWDPTEQAAYVEMAMTSGLELLRDEERDPTKTTTWGTGLQIKDAIERGATDIYLGIGGSATNDGGMGMAAALGYNFLDEDGNNLEAIGANLGRVVSISPPTSSFSHVQFHALNDVNNPLYGTTGAAFVYAPQKGATPEQVQILDAGLRKLEKVVLNDLGQDAAHLPGSGAAGGFAYGLKVFCNARFVSGSSFILQLAGAEKLIETTNPDLIITGEGKLDSQSLSGKMVQGVLELGSSHDIPVIAVCGILEISQEKAMDVGFYDVLEIGEKNKPLSYNLENAATLLEGKSADYMARLKDQGFPIGS